MSPEGRNPEPAEQGATGATVRVFTDSHAHLEMVAERLGRPVAAEVLRAYESQASETGRQILLLDPGVEPDDIDRRSRLAALLLGLSQDAKGRYDFPPWLRFAAGVWPGRPSLDDSEGSVAALEESIDRAADLGVEVAAIGECGLDFHHMEADEAVQRRLFELQIAVAKKRRLPLLVHTRDAAQSTIETLEDAAGGVTVLIHCFGYGPAEAKTFLEMGAFVSFAGNLSYRRSEPLREALSSVPDDRLLLETDAPYMNPEPRRGKPSSPLDVARTYEVAASIRGTTVEALAEIVAANARRLFDRRD